MDEPDIAPEPERLLYLEDIFVGQRFGSDTYELDEAEIKRFALAYDPQPFHLDEVAARDTIFRGLAASGWHTAAITMRLIVTGAQRFAGGVIGAGASVEWPQPTRAGDVLRVEGEVLEITPSRSKPDRGRVRVRNRTLNQRDEVLQLMEANLVVMRRPG